MRGGVGIPALSLMNDSVNLKARIKIDSKIVFSVTTASIKIYGLALSFKFQDADRIFRPIPDRRTSGPGSSGSKTLWLLTSTQLNWTRSFKCVCWYLWGYDNLTSIIREVLAEKNLANAASRRPPAKMLSGWWASAIPWLMFGKNIPRHALKESEVGVQREILLLGHHILVCNITKCTAGSNIALNQSGYLGMRGARDATADTFFHPPLPLSPFPHSHSFPRVLFIFVSRGPHCKNKVCRLWEAKVL